ncbi:hypothetical protein HG531_007635 [Fusarium graminearum]|nr:hypothetical protein HG531_007635 [Fusarium graminearum]
MLEDAAPGGGGNGAIPTLFLSLAAAAAAAEAYLRPSPAGLEGTEAGFIAGVPELPLLMRGALLAVGAHAVGAFLVLKIQFLVHFLILHIILIHAVRHIVSNALFQVGYLFGLDSAVLQGSPDKLQLALMPLMSFDNPFDFGDAFGLCGVVLSLLHGRLYRFALGFESLDLLLQLVDHSAEEFAGLDLCLLFGIELGGG